MTRYGRHTLQSQVGFDSHFSQPINPFRVASSRRKYQDEHGAIGTDKRYIIIGTQLCRHFVLAGTCHF